MSAPSLLRLERRGGGTAWEFVTQAAPTTACVSSSSSLVHTLPGKGSASMNRPAADGKVPPAPSCGGMQFVEAPAVPQSEMPCVGTLRWDEARDFPSLPPFPSRLSRESASAELLGGWRAYLQGRLSPDPSGSVQVEPPMLDGLSYPLTLLLAMRALGLLVPHRKAQLRHVLVIGASSRAEERLVRHSRYWGELSHFLPPRTDGQPLRLVFIGPEIDSALHGEEVEVGTGVMANRFRGTLGEFLASEPTIHSENTLIVGFNTGMGSGLWPLMRSWLTDLLAILRGGFIALFTCANDFSDLRGETLVWELLHARFLIAPQRNPFKAATIVHEPRADASADPEWSCSSCFLYAVCGRDDGAPPLPAPGGEGQLERKMLKLACEHKRTQKPSPMP